MTHRLMKKEFPWQLLISLHNSVIEAISIITFLPGWRQFFHLSL